MAIAPELVGQYPSWDAFVDESLAEFVEIPGLIDECPDPDALRASLVTTIRQHFNPDSLRTWLTDGFFAIPTAEGIAVFAS